MMKDQFAVVHGGVTVAGSDLFGPKLNWAFLIPFVEQSGFERGSVIVWAKEPGPIFVDVSSPDECRKRQPDHDADQHGQSRSDAILRARPTHALQCGCFCEHGA